jgi:hypothetical protein
MMHESRSSPGAASGTGRTLAVSYAQATVFTVVGTFPRLQVAVIRLLPNIFRASMTFDMLG